MVSSMPRPHFIPGKGPVPILQEAGWTSGAGLDGRKISSPPVFNPGPSSPKSVDIPTELPGPLNWRGEATLFSGTSNLNSVFQ